MLVGFDPLPGEQEPHEVRGACWLDLGAQPVECVPVDAREQAAVAPFECGRPAVPGAELAPEDDTLAFQRRERDVGIGFLHTERGRKLSGCYRSNDAEPASEQLAYGLFVGLPRCLGLTDPLCRHPQDLTIG
jgi:hypothetical protein